MPNLADINKAAPLWGAIAVLLFGFLFLAFIIIEYQRNTSLISQNKTLISDAAKTQLVNKLKQRTVNKNWGELESDYDWILSPPNTYWFDNGVQEFPWVRKSTPTGEDQNRQWHKTWLSISSLTTSSVVNQARLKFLIGINAALEVNEEAIIREAFSAYTEHVRSYLLNPEQEIAFSLKLVAMGIRDH